MGEQNIKKNFFYNLIYQIILVASPLVTAPYLSRVLGPVGIGQQSFTTAIVGIFILFGLFGIMGYGQYKISSVRDDRQLLSRTFKELFISQLFTSSLILIIYSIYIFTFGYSGEHFMLFVIHLITIGAAMFDIGWFFQGIEDFKSISLRGSAIKLIGMVLVFVLVKESDDVVLAILCVSIPTLLVNLSIFPLLKKHIMKAPPLFSEIKKHFKEMTVFFIPTLAIQVFTYTDKVMIGIITGDDAQVGFYEQVNKVIKIGTTIVTSGFIIMKSRIRYLFTKNRFEEIQRRTFFFLRFTLFFSIPMVCGALLLADDLIIAVFGDDFAPAIPIMKTMSFAMLIVSISGLIGSHYLTPSGNQRKSNLVFIGALFISVIANALLIPRFGAMGAAYSLILTEGFITIAFYYLSRKHINFKQTIPNLIKYLIAGVVMSLLLYFFPISINKLGIRIVIKIGLGFITYLLVLTILRDNFLLLIYSEIFKLIKKILKRDNI